LRLDQLIKDQQKTAQRVKIEAYAWPLKMIAGIDAAMANAYLCACIGVFSFPDLHLLDHAYAKTRVTMPYIPGFLSYRELPVLIKTFKNLEIKPDLVLVDGQGIAHPRRMGIAAHLGVILNVPTIGCAKSHLFGDYSMPGPERGQFAALTHDGQEIGIVLRTRRNVKPLFVSPGHLVDIRDCLDIVLRATTRYRLPEPIRYAHRMAGCRARSMHRG
jgi:deoxyribonuclease V